MIITPTFTANFDTNFGANAAAAKAAWKAAAQVFTSLFSDNIHINITVDAVAGTNVFGASNTSFLSISYAALLAAVTAHATTPDDQIAIGLGGSIAAADPTNGNGTWWLARPQAKAFGLIPDDMSDKKEHSHQHGVKRKKIWRERHEKIAPRHDHVSPFRCRL